MINRLIIAALPLLALAFSAGAEASLRMDGFAQTASQSSVAGAIELTQHEDTYGDENYFGDQGQTDEYTDEYGDALPEDQPAEEDYADEAAEDEYADEEGYEDEVEVDAADDGDYYNKDPQSLVQPGDTFDPYAPQ